MSLFFKAKCPMCWDSIPRNCPEEKERSYGSRPDTRLQEESNRLAAEQNQLLQKLIDQQGR